MSMLEMKDVHAYYGNIHALKGITIQVEEGEIVTQDRFTSMVKIYNLILHTKSSTKVYPSSQKGAEFSQN